MAWSADESNGYVHLRWLTPALSAAVAHETELGPTLTARIACQSRVIVDLTGVVYVDCLAFEHLLDVVRHCPGKVHFVVSDQGVRSLFHYSQLGLDIHENLSTLRKLLY